MGSTKVQKKSQISKFNRREMGYHKLQSIRSGKAPQTHTTAGQDRTSDSIGIQLVDISSITNLSSEPLMTYLPMTYDLCQFIIIDITHPLLNTIPSISVYLLLFITYNDFIIFYKGITFRFTLLCSTYDVITTDVVHAVAS